MVSKALILTVAIAGSLGLAQSAGAKEIEEVVACGSSECRTLRSPELDLLAEVGSPAQPPSASEFFTFEIVVGAGGDDSRTVYVPSAASLASRPDNGSVRWWSVPPKSATAYREAVRGLEPFPASRFAAGEQARTLADNTSNPWPGQVLPGILIFLGCASVAVFALTRDRRAQRSDERAPMPS